MTHATEPIGPWKRIRWFAWRIGRAVKLAALAFTIDVGRGWTWLLVTGAIVMPALLIPGSLDNQIRYAGYLLEVLGIGTVAWGLRDRAMHHGKPGPLAPLGDRLRGVGKEIASAFRRPPRTVSLSGAVTASSAFSATVATVQKGAPTDASLEERIARVEGRTDKLQERATQLEQQLDQKHREALDAVNTERDAREADTAAVREKMEQVDTGGLHVDWMGFWWLVVGVTLATLSPELAGLWYAL